MASAAPTETHNHRYSVYACDEGRQRAHTVHGDSYEEAAIGFIEAWHPAIDAEGEISVMVIDCETGREQCLRVDVGDGEIRPCG